MAGMFEGYPGSHGTIPAIRSHPDHPDLKEERIRAGMLI